MQHGIIGKDSARDHLGAPTRRARIGWIALAAIGLVAGCGGETKATGGTSTGGTSTGSTGTGAGPAAQCSLGAHDVLVSDGIGTSPSIAFGEDHYLVAWTSTVKDAGDIHVALLDAKGARVSEQVLTEGPGESGFPSVVAEAAGGFLVVWQDTTPLGTVISGRRVDAQGMPKGAPFQIAQSMSAEARPSLAPAAVGTAIVWTDGAAASLGLITGEMLASKMPMVQAQSPTIGGSGANLGVTWIEGPKVGVSKLATPAGPLTPVMFRDAAGKANAPRLAVHDDGALSVVWEDNRAGDGSESVYLTRIDKSGKAGMEKLIPMSPASANYPDVAWTGSNDAVVYYQFRDGPPAIYLSLIGPDLTSNGQDLKISGDGMAARYPRITRTGDALGTLGIAYAEKDGPIRAALVACP